MIDGVPEQRTRDQAKFYTIYRGRQSWLHHLAYMRTSKTKALRLLPDRQGIPLSKMSLFDFGFGAGTLFRQCDPSCRLAGFELDPENVTAVRRMLTKRGHDVSGIQLTAIDEWKSHSLLDFDAHYELIVLSHVLEHLDDPVDALKRLRQNLDPKMGRILALVPINERVPDEDHKWRCTRSVMETWAVESALHLDDYVEVDHWMYWILPIALRHDPFGRFLWQTISVVLGLAQSIFSPAQWFTIGRLVGRVVRAQPTQAAVVLTPAAT